MNPRGVQCVRVPHVDRGGIANMDSIEVWKWDFVATLVRPH